MTLATNLSMMFMLTALRPRYLGTHRCAGRVPVPYAQAAPMGIGDLPARALAAPSTARTRFRLPAPTDGRQP